MKKEELIRKHKEWWYNNPTGSYKRCCQYCGHCEYTNGIDKQCGWWNTTCYDAAITICPIPSAGVLMLNELDAKFRDTMDGQKEQENCGTVVPQSDLENLEP